MNGPPSHLQAITLGAIDPIKTTNPTSQKAYPTNGHPLAQPISSDAITTTHDSPSPGNSTVTQSKHSTRPWPACSSSPKKFYSSMTTPTEAETSNPTHSRNPQDNSAHATTLTSSSKNKSHPQTSETSHTPSIPTTSSSSTAQAATQTGNSAALPHKTTS